MQLKSAYREILCCSSVPSSRVYCTTKIITEIWQSIDLKMKVKHLLLSWFQIPWAPSKYQLTVSANSARLSWPQQLAVNSEGVHGIWKWFEWQFFALSFLYQNWCQIYIRIFSYYVAPETYSGAVSDTYIQKLNSQEHTYNWVHIYIHRQLASLPDEIPSCSNHFHGSQNCACRCRLKKMKVQTIK